LLMRTTGVLPTVPRMLSNFAMMGSAGFAEFGAQLSTPAAARTALPLA
jgi:hypothetical protein